MARAVEAPPLSLAVVGCGRVVERCHVPALEQCPQWTVIGACDPVSDRREWMRGRLEHVNVFESFAELIARCRPDAALVATPPDTHREIVLQALENGMHVLVEKPMALSAGDAEEMRSAALRAGKRIGVGFFRRFKRGFVELRRRLAALGANEVQSIRFDLAGNAETWQAVSGFLGDDALGGGALEDLGSHQMDVLPWLIGQRVKRIRSRGASSTGGRWQRIAYEIDFGSGLIASCTAAHAPNGTERVEIDLRDRRLAIQDNGVIERRHDSIMPAAAYRRLRRLYDRALGRRQTGGDLIAAFAKQLQSFAAVARNGEHHLDIADASSGVAAARLVEACRTSMNRGGEWVGLELPSP